MAERHTHGRMTRTEQRRLARSRTAADAYADENEGPEQGDGAAGRRRYAREVPDEPVYQAKRFRTTDDGTGDGSAFGTAGRSRDVTPAHAVSRYVGAERYSERRRKQGRGRVLRNVLIAVAAVVVVAVVAVAWYMGDLNSRLSGDVSDDLRNQLVSVEPQDPFYMLLLGVDKDEGRSEAWGDDQSNFRSDTIILARVDPPAKKITLVSIPRDTQVDMGQNGKQKINAAYSIGGPAYMVEVVSKFAGVDISHYAEIDFEQFIRIVDTIGGIEVDLPVPVSDMEHAGIDLPAGKQTLDGTQALGLCRSRHAYDAYGGGDFYRAANQRMVIGAILRKVLALDPVNMSSAISTMADGVDTDLSVTDILSLATQFNGLDVDKDVYSGQTPTNSELTDGIWWEIPDAEGWKTMMERVDAGETPYSDASQDFTAGIAGSVSSNGTTISSGEGDGAVEREYSGTVLVLNGTGTTGLAKDRSSELDGAGFEATPDNAGKTQQATAIVYNGDGKAKALGVASTLGVDDSQVIENDGSYSTETDVVVILGEDQVKDQ